MQFHCIQVKFEHWNTYTQIDDQKIPKRRELLANELTKKKTFRTLMKNTHTHTHMHKTLRYIYNQNNKKKELFSDVNIYRNRITCIFSFSFSPFVICSSMLRVFRSFFYLYFFLFFFCPSVVFSLLSVVILDC